MRLQHLLPASLALLLLAAAARAQVPARDLREEVQTIAVQVQDLAGRSEAMRIPLTLYRPAGDGPFPLAIVSHGRDAPQTRKQLTRVRYETLARYLVDKGFAVIVPTRIGYGETYGSFDPESAGSCQAMRPEAMADAGAEQVLAAFAHARTLPWVDATRWIAIGQSVGGVATLAVAARNPPGLRGAINFAGGAGGNPDRRPRSPCSPEALERMWRTRGAASTVPTLWLYWRNDLYWGQEVPARWARAWADGGGRVSMHRLGEVGSDGHQGLTLDMDGWVPIVEDWLATLGFTRPGGVPRPPASGYAQVDEIDKVPLSPAGRESYYRRFLQSTPPRAIAFGPGGAVGWASGDWALGRALGHCQRSRGEPCTLYAVDDEVVWPPGEDDK